MLKNIFFLFFLTCCGYENNVRNDIYETQYSEVVEFEFEEFKKKCPLGMQYYNMVTSTKGRLAKIWVDIKSENAEDHLKIEGFIDEVLIFQERTDEFEYEASAEDRKKFNYDYCSSSSYGIVGVSNYDQYNDNNDIQPNSEMYYRVGPMTFKMNIHDDRVLMRFESE